jgi:hypothetical protein
MWLEESKPSQEYLAAGDMDDMQGQNGFCFYSAC